MAIPLKVLILEDRPTDAELVLRELRLSGFAPDWERVETEADYRARLDPGLDIILADYSMPTFSAPRALEILGESGLDVPLIIVSGTVGEDTAVAAIKLGATDYLLKDRLRRLGAAVQQAIDQRRQRQFQLHLNQLESEISLMSTHNLPLPVMLQRCCQAMVDHLAVAGARLWTRSDKSHALVLAARAGDPAGAIAGFTDSATLGEVTTLGRLAESIQPQLMQAAAGNGATDSAEPWADETGMTTLAAYPLRVDERMLGILVLFARDPLPEPVFIATGTIANQLARSLQHRHTQEALVESELRFRQITENIDEVFWLSNPDTTEMLYISPAYARIWGRSCQSLYDNPRTFLDAVHPDDRPGLEASIRQKRASGRFQNEYRILRPDGSERWIRDSGFPILDAQGNLYRTAGIAQDITEQKALQRQLVQAQKMEAMGQLAGGVAHDFNNLLLIITLSCDLLLSTRSAEDPDFGCIEEILKACQRATQLTQQLLAFSRKQIMEMRVVDVNAVTAGTEKMLRRLIGTHIELTSRYDVGLGRVRADPGQLEQVIINLAVNARDAMPGGGLLTLTTANVTLPAEGSEPVALPPGDYVMLAISDTGTGMTPEIKARVFEPFFTTKPVGKGTGLGLATCFGIIRQSQGLITVESAAGQGTTFRIYLPRVDEPLHSPTVNSSQELPRGTETLLLVEDESTVRAMTARALRHQGFHVLEACDGEEALRIARDSGTAIDLIVADIMMPNMGGEQLCAAIRTFAPATRVLFCSGHLDTSSPHPSLNAPYTDFLQKPFTVAGLIRKVRKLLDARLVFPAASD